MPIIAIRHTDTDMNLPGEEKVIGWLNPSLNAFGKEQAQDVAHQLKDKSFSSILSSDLNRTKETAQIVNVNNSPIHLVSSLRPWNTGILQGKYSDDVANLLKYYIINSALTPRGGESFDNFKQRALQPLQQIMFSSPNGNEQILLTTHGDNLKLFNAWKTAGYPRDVRKINHQDYLDNTFATGSILTF